MIFHCGICQRQCWEEAGTTLSTKEQQTACSLPTSVLRCWLRGPFSSLPPSTKSYSLNPALVAASNKTGFPHYTHSSHFLSGPALFRSLPLSLLQANISSLPLAGTVCSRRRGMLPAQLWRRLRQQAFLSCPKNGGQEETGSPAFHKTSPGRLQHSEEGWAERQGFRSLGYCYLLWWAMWEYKWARDTSQGQLKTRFVSHWNSWHSYRWNRRLCLWSSQVWVPCLSLGRVPVLFQWLHPGNAIGSSLPLLRRAHPETAAASWAHTLLVEVGIQGFALLSPSLRLYLEEGKQKSPHGPPHTLQPPSEEESRERRPTHPSGSCDLRALAQQEEDTGQ